MSGQNGDSVTVLGCHGVVTSRSRFGTGSGGDSALSRTFSIVQKQRQISFPNSQSLIGYKLSSSVNISEKKNVSSSFWENGVLVTSCIAILGRKLEMVESF